MPRAFAKFLRKNRKYFLMMFDFFAIAISYIVPWILIQGRINLNAYFPLMVGSCVFFLCCYEVSYWFFGMYDSLWRYAEVVEFFRLVMASAVAVGVFILGSYIIFYDRKVPISVLFLSAMFSTAITLYARLTYRMYRNTKFKEIGKKKERVLIIGAGEAGATLLHEQFKDPSTEMDFIGVVDDAPEKAGRNLMGVSIMGTTEDIPDIVKKCNIDTILLAIPTLKEENRRRVLDICAKTSCKLRILPDIRLMLTEGEDLSSRIRDVRVEDLLGRQTIALVDRSNEMITGKVVMVTGGGGSIGSELCRQIAMCRPKRLVIVDIYENNAYQIQQELTRKHGKKLNLDVMIASVRDSRKVESLFERFRPQVVFHAAAHKHVPLMEDSPAEAVKNNVYGTFNVVKAADKFNAERFVLISTDKAVNPTNVMGASKRVCEMVVQAMGQGSKTKFVAVRFGNVLGSNGSVLPLFKDQVAAGGPVTVTDPEIVRYFMTIPEAVSLVLEAAVMGEGGEVFVLDMGEPVKILELAEKLIKLAGFMPYKDIQILFTGLRPGEKLYEELLLDEEGILTTANKKIFIGSPLKLNKDSFFKHIETLKEIAFSNNNENIVQALVDLVPTFVHQPHDWES